MDEGKERAGEREEEEAGAKRVCRSCGALSRNGMRNSLEVLLDLGRATKQALRALKSTDSRNLFSITADLLCGGIKPRRFPAIRPNFRSFDTELIIVPRNFDFRLK